MTDAEVWNLIFAPGFSTADVVTDVSGRGVGMDVVKKNITALGGTVEIDSAEGYGMSVAVRLPLTLAIMDGMSVGVGDEVYILPLASVVESFQVEPGTMQDDRRHRPRRRGARRVHAGARPGAGVRRAALRLRARRAASWSSSRPRAGASRCCVDELLGQQQVVVKNLEANYRRVDDISGATIMGDGRVALILDVAAWCAARATDPSSSSSPENSHAVRIASASARAWPSASAPCSP